MEKSGTEVTSQIISSVSLARKYSINKIRSDNGDNGNNSINIDYSL